MSVASVLYVDTFTTPYTLSDIGDNTGIISLNFTIKMLNNIDGVTYDTTGVSSPTKVLEYSWRYSVDNYNWSDWDTFSNMVASINALDADFQKYRHFIFQVVATRAGSDGTGDIDFNGVDVEITDESDDTTLDLTFKRIFKRDTLFSNIEYGDIEVREMAENLLDKVDKDKLMASYIERSDAFYDYFGVMALLLGLCYKSYKRYEDLSADSFLLAEYLTQSGFFLSGEESLSDLVTIRDNFITLMKDRGTADIDARLVELILKEEYDEFIFAYLDHSKVGWYLNSGLSPLYKGVGFIKETKYGYNKFPEYTLTLGTESDYLLLGGTMPVIANSTDPYGGLSNLWQMTYNNISVIGSKVAVNLLTAEKDIIKDGFYVDPNLDYEISGWVKPDSETLLELGCRAYNSDFSVDQQFTKASDGTSAYSGSKNVCLLGDATIQRNDGDWVFFRLIIRHNGYTPVAGETTNLGYGENLIMTANTTYIYPRIGIDQSGSGLLSATEFYGLHFGLCSNDYNMYFINNHNVVDVHLKNNSKVYSITDLSRILRRYYLPANSNLNLNSL